ncbi:hypothetical protein SH661x_003647 [Planctomicrobium sp. SH661]|uniref:hypothetical protein n=1 Tax=Planctomicrobium sp. SH661 TaxID=3448124 RepID=UPI003F5BA0A0
MPRETMIPGNWKIIISLGVLGFLAWAAIVWLSLASWSHDMGIAELVDLGQGAVPRYFSTVALLLIAQLNLLIYWHRSCSRKDFLGRYRIWGWAGLFWCVVCLANATQLHIPVLDYLNSHVQINCWRGHNLFWFLPLSIGMLSLYRLVGRDISGSKPSTIAWNIAFGLSLLVGSLHFGADLLLPSEARIGVTVAVTMLWQCTLAFFCLIHARYVTHVTNEVSGKRQSLRSRVSRRMTQRITLLGERILQAGQPLRKISWKRVRAEKVAVEKVSKKKPKADKPAAVEKNVEKPVETQAVAKPVDKRASAKSTAKPAEESNSTPKISWGQRLQQSILSRWKRRVDPAQPAEAVVAPPHVPVAKPKPERNAVVTKTIEPAATPVQPQSKPAPAPVPSSKPAQSQSSWQQEEDDDDYDSGDNDSGMSSRERKRLKKLQRQQNRS